MTSPVFRNRGIATYRFSEALHYIRNSGYTICCNVIVPDNIASRRVVEKPGARTPDLSLPPSPWMDSVDQVFGRRTDSTCVISATGSGCRHMAEGLPDSRTTQVCPQIKRQFRCHEPTQHDTVPLMPTDATPTLKPLKWYRNLATRKGRLEAGAFLVEGDRAIEQIVRAGPDEILELLSTDNLPPRFHNYPSRLLTENHLRYISSTKTPQGTLAVVRLPTDAYADKLPVRTGNRILLLEHVQDPGNVGALIRTAAAFGFDGAILTEHCADPFSPKCVQSTAGTVLSLWMRRTSRYEALLEELRQYSYSLVAADVHGLDDVSVLRRESRLVLALGNEASGLSNSVLSMSDYRVRLPTVREKAESLNVAACGAIFMYLTYHNQ